MSSGGHHWLVLVIICYQNQSVNQISGMVQETSMWREVPKIFLYFLPKNSQNTDKMSNYFDVNHEKNENDHKYQG